jgi:predicted glutamine amidotransferase
MLGFISRMPKPICFYLEEAPRSLRWLSLHGQKAPHRDGLGMAYKNVRGQIELFKAGQEELPQLETEGFSKIRGLQTTLLLAHARQASKAYRQMTETAQAQPLSSDGLYLTHNGTIHDVAKLGTLEGTDSQKLLHWLAQNWQPRNSSGLKDALQKLLKLIQDYTAINLLITDGSHLYAFCCYRREAEYYTLHYNLDENLVTVASEPLDDEPWQQLGSGVLLQITPRLTHQLVQVI